MSNLLLQLSPQDSKFIKKMTHLSDEDRVLVEYVVNATGVSKAAIVELTKIPRTELKSVKRLVQLYDDYKKGTTESKVIEFVKLITAMPLEMVTFWKKLLHLNDSELELINTYIQFCPTEKTFASNFVQWYLKQTPFNFLTRSKGEEISFLESSENVGMEILVAEEKFKKLFKKYILEQGNTVGKIVTRGVHSDEQCLNLCGEETIKVQTHLHKDKQFLESISDKNASMEKKTYCISQSTEVGKLISKAVIKDKTCDKFENEKGRQLVTERINADKQSGSETEIPTNINVDNGKFINRTQVDKIIMGNNKEQPQNVGHQDMNDLKTAGIETDVSNNCSINYDRTTNKHIIASGSSQNDHAQNKDPDIKTSEISVTDASKFSVYVMKVDGSNFIVRGKNSVSIPPTAEELVLMDNKHHNTTDRPVCKNIDNEMNDPRKSTCSSLFISQPGVRKISSNTSEGNMNNLLINSQTLAASKMPVVQNNVLNSEKPSLNKTQVASDVNAGIVQAGTSKTRSCEFSVMQVRGENCLENAQKEQKSCTQMVQRGLNVSQEKLRTYLRTSRSKVQNKTQTSVTTSDTNTITRSPIFSSNNSNTMQGDVAISNVNFDAKSSQDNLSTVYALQSSIMNLKENSSSNQLQREVAVNGTNVYQTNAASIPSLPVKQYQAKTVLPNILFTENLSSATELQPQSFNVPQKDIGTSVKSNSQIASVTSPCNMSHAGTSKTVMESFKAKIPSVMASSKSQMGIKTSVMVTSHITESAALLRKSVSQTNIGNLAVNTSQIATTAIPNRMSQTGNGNSAVNTSEFVTASVPEEMPQTRRIGNSAVITSQIATAAIPIEISQAGIGNSSINMSQITTAAVSNRKSHIGKANSAINTPHFATTALPNRMSQTGIRNASVSTSQITTLAVPKRMSQTGIGNSAVNTSQIAMTAILNRISQTEIGNSSVNTTAAISNRMSKTGNANSAINTSKIATTSVPNRTSQTGNTNSAINTSQIATSVPNRISQIGNGNSAVNTSQITTAVSKTISQTSGIGNSALKTYQTATTVPKTISQTWGIGNSAVKTSQIATAAIPNRMPLTGIGNAFVSASQIATTAVPKTISHTSRIGNSAVKTSQIATTAILNRMSQTGNGNSAVNRSQITTAVPKTISQTSGIGNSAVKTSQIATAAIPIRMPITGIRNASVSASQIATTAVPKTVSQTSGIGNLAVKTSQIASTAIPNRMSQTGIGNASVSTSQIAITAVPKTISQTSGIGNLAVKTSQIASTAIPNRMSQTGFGNASVSTSQIATMAVRKTISHTSGIGNLAVKTSQIATTAIPNRMSKTGNGNSAVNRSQIATAVPKTISQTSGIRNSAVKTSQIATVAIPNGMPLTGIGNASVSASQITTTAVPKTISQTLGIGNLAVKTSQTASTAIPNRMSQTGIGNASVSTSQIATTAVPKTISQMTGIGNSAVKTSQIATTAIPNRMFQTEIGNAFVSRSQIATTAVPKTISQTSGIGNSAVKTSQIATTAIPNKMSQTGIGNASVGTSQIPTRAVSNRISQTGYGNSAVNTSQIATFVPNRMCQIDSPVPSNSHATLSSQKNLIKSVAVLTPFTISTIQPNYTYVPVTVASGTHANYVIGPIVQTATIVSSTIPTVIHCKPTIPTTKASTSCSSISLSSADASPTELCTGILKSALTSSTIPSVVNTVEPSSDCTKLHVGSPVMHCDAAVKPSLGLLQAEANTNKSNKTFIQCSEEPKARLLDVGVSPAISTLVRSGIPAVGKLENPILDVVADHTTVTIITMDNENKSVTSFSQSQSKEEQIQKIPSAAKSRPNTGCLQKEMISQVHHLDGIAKKIQKFQDEDVNDQHVFDRLMTQIKWFIPGYKVFRFHLEKFLGQIKGDSDICRTLTVYKKLIDRHIKMVSDFTYKYIAIERKDIIQKIVELMIMVQEVKRQVEGINVNDFKEEGLRNCGCPYDPSLGGTDHLTCWARVHGTAKDHESNKSQTSNVEIPSSQSPVVKECSVVETRSQSPVVKECSVELNDVKHILKNRSTINCNEVKPPKTSEGQKFIVGSVTIPGNTQNFLGFRGFGEDEIACSKRKLCRLHAYMESDKKKRKIQKSGSNGNSGCSSNMLPEMEVLCSGDNYEDSSKDAVNDVSADAIVIKEENISVSAFNSVAVVSEDFNFTNCDEPMICVKQEDMDMEDPLKDNTIIKIEELVKTECSEIEIEDHTITPSDLNQAVENSASQAKRQKGWKNNVVPWTKKLDIQGTVSRLNCEESMITSMKRNNVDVPT